ncbi:hypothetical protein UT300003_32860 [Clostridium sardiniense]
MKKKFLIETKIYTGESDVIENTLDYLTVDVDECSIVESKIVEDLGELSDGYHTFNELYYHRMVLFSVICNKNKDKAWKSLKHHDDTMYDDYFIVGIDTPKGQYSYHYHKDYWDMFNVKELPNAPIWDGHKPEDITRLISLI